jgi:hypothetical protein
MLAEPDLQSTSAAAGPFGFEAGRIRSRAMRAFFAKTEELRGARRFLSRADFLPEVLAPWWPDIFLLDVVAGEVPGEPAFRFRLTGTRLDFRAGFNMTGQVVSRGRPGDGQLGHYLTYRAVWRDGKPSLQSARIALPAGEVASFERIVLPLSGDQQSVDMLLGMALFDNMPMFSRAR